MFEMSKEQINSILEANTYLISCKCNSKCKTKFDYARKYMNIVVRKVLYKPKKEKNSNFFPTFLHFIF
jgi:hypothetical protein